MEALDLTKYEKEFTNLQRHIDEVGPCQENMMSILNFAQKEFGYLPIEVQEYISDQTKVPLSTIYGIVTFYSNFTLEPKGEFDVGICLGTACYVRGAQDIVDALSDELGIGVEETTEDGKFSMTALRCIGACGLAPVITINGDVYGNITKADIPGIIKNYK